VPPSRVGHAVACEQEALFHVHNGSPPAPRLVHETEVVPGADGQALVCEHPPVQLHAGLLEQEDCVTVAPDPHAPASGAQPPGPASNAIAWRSIHSRPQCDVKTRPPAFAYELSVWRYPLMSS